MRKIAVLLVLAVLVLTSIASASHDVVIERVELIEGRDGSTYLVDENTDTISCGGIEYKFSVSGNGESIEITYPDGSTYWESGRNSAYSAGWSDDYIAFTEENEKNYKPGDILCDVYRSENPVRERKSFWRILIGSILGLFSLLLPEAAWYLHIGWKIKDAEPSDAAIIMERIGGGILVALVILYIIF